jgi:4-hydroxy-tetrahydrodipicolinate synthase
LSTFQIQGIVPIIPTPFFESGQIDYDSLRAELDFAAVSGACAVCLPAYASEFYKLSEQERQTLISEAVKHLKGRIPLIGQANNLHSQHAAQLAKSAEEAGADAIAVAAPRIFPVADRDLFRYFETILKAIRIPLIIQDFNPGGPTMGPQFITELNRAYSHFRYVKLEEPLMANKVAAIVSESEGRVGVLEGWGGMYMLELLEAGVCGIMPGLGVADILSRIYALFKAGRKVDAFELHHAVLPQIVYSLQNMELFHYAEKQLLKDRGIIPRTTVRDISILPGEHELRHIRFLNDRILALLDREEIPRNAAAVIAQ